MVERTLREPGRWGDQLWDLQARMESMRKSYALQVVVSQGLVEVGWLQGSIAIVMPLPSRRTKMGERLFQTGQGRVFVQPYGAGPGHSYQYMGHAKLGGLTKPFGDITPVKSPSRTRYDQFDVVDEVRGEADLPSTSIVARFGLSNMLLELTCPFDVQAHYGKCTNPSDYLKGWEKILHYEHARLTNVSSDDQTALDESERANILLTGELAARMVWEVDPVTLAEKAAAEVSRTVVAVQVYDYPTCGDCGRESLGCSRIFAVTRSSGSGSPGLPAELLVSEDGGQTWAQYAITTLASGEQPSDMACVGDYIVVVSEDSGSMHYATIEDPSTWTEVATGFVGAPRAIFALSSTEVWIVGLGGYIYFTDDITEGVEVQDAGIASGGDDLFDIHGCDAYHLVAIGEAGVVVYTSNGGGSWMAATDVSLIAASCVWVRSENCWMVGTAHGYLFYTTDYGDSWVEKTFPGARTGGIGAIAFADHPDSPFGYLAHNTGTEGHLLRSLDGGNKWYILPEGAGAIPTNFELLTLGVCNNANFVVAGGSRDATDGIIVIGKD